MTMLGGFAGGVAEGIQTGRENQLKQQYVGLQQQQMQNQQQRFQQSQYMDLYKQGVDHMQEFFTQWKLAHPEGDIKQAAQAMAPTKENLKTLLKNMGQNPDSIEGLWAGMLASDPLKAIQSTAAAKEGPLGRQEKETLIEERRAQTEKIKQTTPGATGSLAGLHGTEMLDVLSQRSGLTSTAVDQAARRLNAGDTSVLTNLGRGAQGPEAIKAIRNWAAEVLQAEQGMMPQEAADYVKGKTAGFFGEKAAERTLGTRAANLSLAGNAFLKVSELVTDLSKKVPRTNYPTLNSILEATLEKTGDPNVVSLKAVINGAINTYARAINPTGQPTISDKDHAREILDMTWSQGQIEAGIATLRAEIEKERESLPEAKKEIEGAYGGKKNQSQAPSGKPVYKFNTDTGELEGTK